MAYRTLYKKLNGIQNTAQKTKQWHTEHCIKNQAIAYKTQYRKLNNGIQNTVQKTKQWHTENQTMVCRTLYKKLNGIQNTAQKTKQ